MDATPLLTLATPTNVLWSLSILLGGYVARSLNQLNEKMAVVVTKVAMHDEQIRDHTADIKELLKQTKGIESE